MHQPEADHLATGEDNLMESISIINFRPRPSGALMGFGDLAIGGMVILSCKIFYKPSTNQGWIAPPSDKAEGKDGPVYIDRVQFTQALQKHISHSVFPQIQQLAGVSPAPRVEAQPGQPDQVRDDLHGGQPGGSPSAQQPLPSANRPSTSPSPARLDPRSTWKPKDSAGRDTGYAASRKASEDPLGQDIPY